MPSVDTAISNTNKLDQKLIKVTIIAERDKAAAIKSMNNTVNQLKQEVQKLKSRFTAITLNARQAYEELEAVVVSIAETEKMLIRVKKADPTDIMLDSLTQYIKVLQIKQALLLNLCTIKINEENQLSTDLKAFTDPKLKSPNYFSTTAVAAAARNNPMNMSKVPNIAGNAGVKGTATTLPQFNKSQSVTKVTTPQITKIQLKQPILDKTPTVLNQAHTTTTQVNNIMHFPNIHINPKMQETMTKLRSQLNNSSSSSVTGQNKSWQYVSPQNATSAAIQKDSTKIIEENQQEMLQLMEKAYNRDELFQNWQKTFWNDFERKLNDNMQDSGKGGGKGSGGGGKGGGGLFSFLEGSALAEMFGFGAGGFIAKFMRKLRGAGAKTLSKILKGAQKIARDGLLSTIEVGGKSVGVFIKDLSKSLIIQWSSLQKLMTKRVSQMYNFWKNIGKVPGGVNRHLKEWSRMTKNLFDGTVNEVVDFAERTKKQLAPVTKFIGDFVEKAKKNSSLIPEAFKKTFPESAEMFENWTKNIANATKDMRIDIVSRLAQVDKDFSKFSTKMVEHVKTVSKTIGSFGESTSKHFDSMFGKMGEVTGKMGTAVADAAKSAQIAPAINNIAASATEPLGIFGHSAKTIAKVAKSAKVAQIAKAAKPVLEPLGKLFKLAGKAAPGLNAISGGFFNDSNMGHLSGSSSIGGRIGGAIGGLAFGDLDIAKDLGNLGVGGAMHHDGSTMRHVLSDVEGITDRSSYARGHEKAQELLKGNPIILEDRNKKSLRKDLNNITQFVLNLADDAVDKVSLGKPIDQNSLPSGIKFLSVKENSKFLELPGMRRRIGNTIEQIATNTTNAANNYYNNYDESKPNKPFKVDMPDSVAKIAADFVKWKSKTDPKAKIDQNTLDFVAGKTNASGVAIASIPKMDVTANKTAYNANQFSITNPNAPPTKPGTMLGATVNNINQKYNTGGSAYSEFNGGNINMATNTSTSNEPLLSSATATSATASPSTNDPYTNALVGGVKNAGGSVSGVPSTSVGSSVPITGSSFKDKSGQVVGRLMKDFNLTKEQAVGAVGNLGHESGGFKSLQEINPVNGGRGGYGWAQWTGSRRDDYMAWAKTNKLDPASDEANYGFLKHELSTTHKGTIAALKKTNSVTDATAAFEKSYEGADPRYVNMESRNKYAQQASASYDQSQIASANGKPATVASSTPNINPSSTNAIPSTQVANNTTAMPANATPATVASDPSSTNTIPSTQVAFNGPLSSSATAMPASTNAPSDKVMAYNPNPPAPAIPPPPPKSVQTASKTADPSSGGSSGGANMNNIAMMSDDSGLLMINLADIV